MKPLLTLPLLLLSLISFPSWSETMNDLVYRDGLYYKKFSDVPFSGEVEGREQGKFKSGKREGPWVEFYENGQLDFKGEYRNGKREGPWVEFYENGQLSIKGEYRNGKQEGPWVEFYNDGFWRSKGGYRNGWKDGPWVTYNANGQLDSKGEYRSGKHEGRWVYYDYYGILIKGLSGVFKNDVKISD